MTSNAGGPIQNADALRSLTPLPHARSVRRAVSQPSRSPAEHRALRPYRVFVYVLGFSFTVLFIVLIGRSVWLDLYGRGPTKGLRAEAPSINACVDELEALFTKLNARAAMQPGVTSEKDWDTFTREFEDRLGLVQSRCVDESVGGDEGVRTALRDAADKLDSWRQHMSRCGEDGESERKVLADAIARLRAAPGLR